MLIKKYNPEWAFKFEKIKEELMKHFTDVVIEIHHIGGTSVIGLSSKPIIDIDIVYYNLNEFEKIKITLESVGYHHNGDQGIIGREVFKRNKTCYNDVLDQFDHHLYVCRFDSNELQKHLLFRDYLRKNDDVRLTYQKLKQEIASEAKNDKKTYANLKEIKAKSFINNIIEQAKIK